jgi:ketosteroid isomerase-like protein
MHRTESENAKLWRRLLGAWNRRDLEGVLEVVHPNVAWEENVEVFPGLDPVYRGHDGFKNWYQQVQDAWEMFEVESVDLFSAEDRFLSLDHLVGRGRGSGVEVDMRIWDVLDVRDDRVVRRRLFRERSEAFEAAGIEDDG